MMRHAEKNSVETAARRRCNAVTDLNIRLTYSRSHSPQTAY